MREGVSEGGSEGVREEVIGDDRRGSNGYGWRAVGMVVVKPCSADEALGL